MESRTRLRAVFALIVCSLLLAGTAGILSTSSTAEGAYTDTGRDDVLFVSTQSESMGQSSARVVAINLSTGTTVWRHDAHATYYDVDPMGESEVVFVAEDPDRGMFLYRMNWQTGEVITRFSVPPDTHDVDYLGDGRYVVADKTHHAVYVYDATEGEKTWNYSFAAHFSHNAGDGVESTDYTHVNDIDVMDDGSAFLTSPRNFDRVVAINRTTKETEWVLGEEDNHDILFEQHNPVLLSQDPRTVLVADSENNRVVEYEQTGHNWTATWQYHGRLNWPRDADRLPNGNTLVVDSAGQRVLEVTPKGTVRWEFTIPKMPYDAELRSLGDEPDGPPMSQVAPGADPATDSGRTSALPAGFSHRLSYLHQLSQWVLPGVVSVRDFVLLALALMASVVWLGTELSFVLPRWSERVRRECPRYLFAAGTPVLFSGVGIALLAWTSSSHNAQRFGFGIGLVLLVATGSRLRADSHELFGDRPHVETMLGILTVVGAVVAALFMGWKISLDTNIDIFYGALGVALGQISLQNVPETVRTINPRLARYAGLGARLATPVTALLGLYLVYRGVAPSQLTVYVGFGVWIVGLAILMADVEPSLSLQAEFQRLRALTYGLPATVGVTMLVTTTILTLFGGYPPLLSLGFLVLFGSVVVELLVRPRPNTSSTLTHVASSTGQPP